VTIVESDRAVIGGVDTHLDVHVAAALDPIGGLLGVSEFATTAAGYKELFAWLSGFGRVERVGVEGTGSYGAGLARFLLEHDVEVLEVDRPNRQVRARRGKSDPVDAVEAARAAQSRRAAGIAKSRDGAAEAIRALVVVKRSARNQRIAALVQMRHLVFTAPEEVRARFLGLTKVQLVTHAAVLRPRAGADVVAYATKVALRELARRVQHLNAEIKLCRRLLGPLVEQTAPGLLALHGIGVEVAAVLLVAAGDNPERLRSEAAFAHLCGVAPLEASSGKVTRHRLNFGGNRQANHALYRIVITRMSSDPRTKRYVERRSKEGKSTAEIVRVLKRYIAREVFKRLPRRDTA
jgi:transposase